MALRVHASPNSRRGSLVIVSAVFSPEPFVSARISEELARRFGENGWAVTVLCPPPSRPPDVDYRWEDCSRTLAGVGASVCVQRVGSWTAPRGGLLARAFESWSFGRLAAAWIRSMPDRPDVVYVNAWPILAQRLTVNAARSVGARAVLHVQDAYPEALLPKLPALVRPVAGAVLRGVDRKTAAAVEKVVVVSRAMRGLYIEDRGLDESAVALCHNWQDEETFDTSLGRDEARRKFGLDPNGFVFLYCGNIGPVAGVEDVIVAFNHARPPGARLVIVGGGSRKLACEKLALSLRCPSIVFLSVPDAKDSGAIHAIADVCVLPMRRGTGSGSVPSKLAGYLLAARPVLAAVDEGSEAERIVRESGGGWVGRSEDIEWFAAEMTRLVMVESVMLDQLGRRGRSYALEHFSKRRGVEQLASIVEAAATRSRQP